MKKIIVFILITACLFGYVGYTRQDYIIKDLLKNRKVRFLLIKGLKTYNRYKRLNAKNKGDNQCLYFTR